jgi:hypothetical protein
VLWVADGTGGTVGRKTIQFEFRLTSWTTDEEVQKFAQLMKEKGADALRPDHGGGEDPLQPEERAIRE